MDTSKVTRFEIIDHTPCNGCDGDGFIDNELSRDFPQPCPDCQGMGSVGRTVVVHNPNVQIDVDLQDDDRTLKVFIHPRYEEL